MPLKPVIYFCKDAPRKLIKIGFSENPQSRVSDHMDYGLTLIAAIPARLADEKDLHKTLAPYRNGNGNGNKKEWYLACDEIYNFITNLIVRGYAARTIDDAQRKPYVPYVSWKFGTLINWTDPDGQISLLEQYSPEERVKAAHVLPYLSSITDEWFTPKAIVDTARLAMGSIDLDPASCFDANESINAEIWYSREVDGLDIKHDWNGNVWLNPPYGTGDHSAARFVERLVKEYQKGNVSQAITLLNLNSSCALWFDIIWETAACHLVYRGRINFVPPGGKIADSSPTKGSILSYFGANTEGFMKHFGPLGTLISVGRP